MIRGIKNEKTFELLKERTKVNFVSTIDGYKPSCRLFGVIVLFDNKIIVGRVIEKYRKYLLIQGAKEKCYRTIGDIKTLISNHKNNLIKSIDLLSVLEK